MLVFIRVSQGAWRFCYTVILYRDLGIWYTSLEMSNVGMRLISTGLLVNGSIHSDLPYCINLILFNVYMGCNYSLPLTHPDLFCSEVVGLQGNRA